MITGKAKNLKGHGHIDYVISNDCGLYLQITSNSKGGKFTKKPIYLCKLLRRIVEVSSDKGYFKRKDLRKVIGGNNNNNSGFVVAILMDIRFVESAGKKGQYRLGWEGG